MTPQDKLFLLHIKNFVNDVSGHRQWLNTWLSMRLPDVRPDIDAWMNDENLPELTSQSRIMDAIWTHHCDCKCQ